MKPSGFRFKPRQKRVNAVTLEPFVDVNVKTEPISVIMKDASGINVPDDDRARAVHHRYVGALYQLTGCPVLAFNQQCLVCGGDHRFDGCPVLANTDFLRAHYIRSCQYFRREAQARAGAFHGQERQTNFPSVNQGVITVGVTDDSSPYSGSDPEYGECDKLSDTEGELDFP
jgi:hypothetical protein